jgi:hypothetical protein
MDINLCKIKWCMRRRQEMWFKTLRCNDDRKVNVLMNGRAVTAMNRERNQRNSDYLVIRFSGDLKEANGGCGKLENKWVHHLLYFNS